MSHQLHLIARRGAELRSFDARNILGGVGSRTAELVHPQLLHTSGPGAPETLLFKAGIHLLGSGRTSRPFKI